MFQFTAIISSRGLRLKNYKLYKTTAYG